MSKELVERLRKISTVTMFNEEFIAEADLAMGDAADEIERLNGIIDAAMSLCEDVYGAGYIMLAFSKAHKVKE